MELDVDFSALILSLAASAMVGLGVEPDPQTGQINQDRSTAKFNIDLLILLQQKTKGNLTAPEQDLLQQLLSDLQIRFVQTAKNK